MFQNFKEDAFGQVGRSRCRQLGEKIGSGILQPWNLFNAEVAEGGGELLYLLKVSGHTVLPRFETPTDLSHH